MKNIQTVLSLLLAGAAMAGCAALAPAPLPATAANGILTDAHGMTLYTFDRDVAGSGKSACAGQCAVNWPVLRAQADDQPRGDYAIIARDDGVRQWTYKGKPLYRWIKDQKPGEQSGDGVNQVWRVARP